MSDRPTPERLDYWRKLAAKFGPSEQDTELFAEIDALKAEVKTATEVARKWQEMAERRHPDIAELTEENTHIKHLLSATGIDPDWPSAFVRLKAMVGAIDKLIEIREKNPVRAINVRWWTDEGEHDADEQRCRERRALHNITYNLKQLTDDLIDKLEVWIHERESIPNIKAATAGNRYSISIYPTGIGDVYTVKDPVGPEENNEIDLTDVENW